MPEQVGSQGNGKAWFQVTISRGENVTVLPISVGTELSQIKPSLAITIFAAKLSEGRKTGIIFYFKAFLPISKYNFII